MESPFKKNDFVVIGVILLVIFGTAILVALVYEDEGVDAKGVLDGMCKRYGNGSIAMDVKDHDGWFEVRCARDVGEFLTWENTTQ